MDLCSHRAHGNVMEDLKQTPIDGEPSCSSVVPHPIPGMRELTDEEVEAMPDDEMFNGRLVWGPDSKFFLEEPNQDGSQDGSWENTESEDSVEEIVELVDVTPRLFGNARPPSTVRMGGTGGCPRKK